MIEAEENKEYLPIDGLPSFKKATIQLLLGADHPAVKEVCLTVEGCTYAPTVMLGIQECFTPSLCAWLGLALAWQLSELYTEIAWVKLFPQVLSSCRMSQCASISGTCMLVRILAWSAASPHQTLHVHNI